jgi:hypothetical protein
VDWSACFYIKEMRKTKKYKATNITCFSITEKRKEEKDKKKATTIMSGVVYVACDTSLNAMGTILRVYISSSSKEIAPAWM